MAMADYYLCDACSGKTFYDRVLDYQRDDEGNITNVGDMAVLCTECAKTRKLVIVFAAAVEEEK